ncbi:MAG TPA: glycogen phosphorylase, partial [Alphaproteobacteria bacterium]|nr:glycogen phosphorylase [Alphaproteobacteria bacterium]
MDARIKPTDLQQRSLDVEGFKQAFLEWLVYSVGKDKQSATARDWYTSAALAVRDRVVDRWMDTTRAYYQQDVKRVYYLSLEFLIGRLLSNGLVNLQVMDAVRQALAELGIRLEDVIEAEPDAALGNGGL